MNLLARTLLIPLGFVAAITAAHADSAARVMAGVSIDFPTPKGFCVADPNNFADAQFINTVNNLLAAAQNKLILTTIDCDTLQKIRARTVERIMNYALYYTPSQVENQSFSGDQSQLRKGLCSEMRTQGNVSLDNLKDIIAQKAKEMGQDFGVTSAENIGVIDEDDNGCYSALLIGVRDAKGDNKIMSAIVTGTLVRGKLVFLAYYSEFKGPETTTAGLEASKATAAELNALNQ